MNLPEHLQPHSFRPDSDRGVFLWQHCTVCKCCKHPDEFYDDPRKESGKSSVCKLCQHLGRIGI